MRPALISVSIAPFAGQPELHDAGAEVVQGGERAVLLAGGENGFNRGLADVFDGEQAEADGRAVRR